MQEEGAGHGKGPQQHAKEVAAGLHGPAAAHPAGHLQGEQAAVQGDAAHHLAAAGPRTHHRQQLLHERPPTQRQQVGRRGPPVLHGFLGLQRLLLRGVLQHGMMTDRRGGGAAGRRGDRREQGGHVDWSRQRSAVLNVLLVIRRSDGAEPL